MKEYFIINNLNEQKGPFSLAELKEIGITRKTLVWKEDFENWVEAEKIEDLKTIIKITPPPIPVDINKKKDENPTVNVNLGFGINKGKEDNKIHFPEKAKIKTARELKMTYKLFLLSLLLSIISYPIAAWKDFKALSLKSKYEQVKYDKNSLEYFNVTFDIWSVLTDEGKNTNTEYCSSIKWDDPNSLYGHGTKIWDYDCILNNYNVFKDDNIAFFFIFLFSSFFVIIIIRYVFIATKKTTKWVNENSQKEV